jgi:uncharacterized protein involved in type VI secretion and phage assembly
MNERVLMDLVERSQHRFYGKYRGTVTKVDTENGLRIKAKVPAVLGDQETGWCMACVPYAGNGVAFAFAPEEHAGVWIEFEGGDVSYPIWAGCYWHDKELPKRVQPEVKVIQTKSGHQIVLDDNKKEIVITDRAKNTITLADQGITIERKDRSVVVSESEVNVNKGGMVVT